MNGTPRYGWVAVLLLVMVGHGVLYNAIGELAAARGIDLGPRLETPLDHRVPFVPAFVVPYLFAWAFPLVLVGWLVREWGPDPVVFRRLAASFLVLMLSCYLLWIAFPVRVGLRLDESVLASHGLLGDLVRFNYDRASQWNACPSFHVAGPWLLWRAVSALPGRRVPAWGPILVIAITASTVLIRIHYLADIAGGIAVAELVHRLTNRRLVTHIRPLGNRNRNASMGDGSMGDGSVGDGSVGQGSMGQGSNVTAGR